MECCDVAGWTVHCGGARGDGGVADVEGVLLGGDGELVDGAVGVGGGEGEGRGGGGLDEGFEHFPGGGGGDEGGEEEGGGGSGEIHRVVDGFNFARLGYWDCTGYDKERWLGNSMVTGLSIVAKIERHDHPLIYALQIGLCASRYILTSAREKFATSSSFNRAAHDLRIHWPVRIRLVASPYNLLFLKQERCAPAVRMRVRDAFTRRAAGRIDVAAVVENGVLREVGLVLL